MLLIYLLTIIIITLFIFLVIFLIINRNKKPDNSNSSDNSSEFSPSKYIDQSPSKETDASSLTPVLKSVCYINDLSPRQKLADNCNKVMYPINPIYVNYDRNTNTKKCKCDNLIFNSPP